jgi:hypothetical protein
MSLTIFGILLICVGVLLLNQTKIKLQPHTKSEAELCAMIGVVALLARALEALFT